MGKKDTPLKVEKSMSLAGAYGLGILNLIQWSAIVIGVGIVNHIVSHVGNGVTAKIFGKKE